MEYTDEEILAELARLGYTNVSEQQLRVFKLNLMKLIRSEKSAKAKPAIESCSFNQESSGNISNHGNQWLENTNVGISNHGNQWLENTTNHNTDWVYGDVGKSYGLAGSDASALMSKGGMYGTKQSLLDVGSDIRRPEFSLDLHRSSLRDARSEPNVRPKSVKWNLANDSFKIIPANETKSERTETFGNTYRGYGDYKREPDGYDPTERPASADTDPYEGFRVMFKKIPGIITSKEHPHTRHLVKTKPFERHQMYMKEWKARPPVGEANRTSVCWEVHRRLLKKEEIVKFPSKSLTPNSYIVPTDKPRYELRWAVRHCNENFEMPPCGFFP
ncbi:hypothetical protein BsWGS_10715 [Bradybaena similaris]